MLSLVRDMTTLSSTSTRVLACAAAAAALVACTTITEELPGQPNSAPSGPSVVVVVPVPVPATPAPQPQPQPTSPGNPTPTPAPAPTPAPPPVTGLGCGLPKGTGSGNDCPRSGASFLRDVELAIDRTIAQHPEMFDLNRSPGAGSYFIKVSRERYYAEVARQLNAMGYCAIDDSAEMAVKNTNSFNDQYRIDNSSGFIRRGDGAYRSTCRPAWF
jgi:hypothetical protein